MTPLYALCIALVIGGIALMVAAYQDAIPRLLFALGFLLVGAGSILFELVARRFPLEARPKQRQAADLDFRWIATVIIILLILYLKFCGRG